MVPGQADVPTVDTLRMHVSKTSTALSSSLKPRYAPLPAPSSYHLHLGLGRRHSIRVIFHFVEYEISQFRDLLYVHLGQLLPRIAFYFPLVYLRPTNSPPKATQKKQQKNWKHLVLHRILRPS